MLSLISPSHTQNQVSGCVDQALYAPSLPSACSPQELDAENFLLACVDFYLSPPLYSTSGWLSFPGLCQEVLLIFCFLGVHLTDKKLETKEE